MHERASLLSLTGCSDFTSGPNVYQDGVDVGVGCLFTQVEDLPHPSPQYEQHVRTQAYILTEVETAHFAFTKQ